MNSVQNPSISDQPKSNSSLESNSQSPEDDIPVTGPQKYVAGAADNDYNNNNNHPKTINKETDDEVETSWLNQVLQHD